MQAISFQRAIDSLYRRLGRDALYDNGDTPPFLIRVISRRAEHLLELGEDRLHAEDAHFEFRVTEVPSPRCGDEINLDGRTYRVEEEPMLDLHHLVWSVETLPYLD